MSGQPIWGSDVPPAERARAQAAGWTRADLAWEALSEQGNAAFDQGDLAGAGRAFRRARWIALLRFSRADLRRATALANLGALDLACARARRGRARLSAALARWDRHSAAAIAAMQIAPRARSSLFHLRMEALHRDTYHGNLKLRIGRIAGETRDSLQAAHDGQPAPHRHFARWKGERPTVYDDTRKILAACLLFAAPR